MSSTTLKTILETFIRQYHLGRVGTTTATGTTATLVDAPRFSGPFAGNEFGRGCPVRITGRAAVGGGAVTVGQNTFISDYDPSTGTLTVLPVLDDTAEIGASFIVMFPGVMDHTDRMVEFLNHYLGHTAQRRMRVPLTYVPNGDYLALLASTGWTPSGTAAVAYSELAHPDGWYQRELKVTGGTGLYASSTIIKANAANNLNIPELWNVATTIRVGVADQTASFVIFDETNQLPIVPTWLRGTGTTTSLSPVESWARFTIPANCTQISFRPTVAITGQVGYFGPVIAAPVNATLYTGQTWLEYLKRVEGLWTFSMGTYGPTERRWSKFQLGRHDDQLSWGQGFSFETLPPFPLFVDALLAYPDIVAGDPTGAGSGSAASESDTTACPAPLAIAGLAVEVFNFLHDRDAVTGFMRGKVLITSPWLARLNLAKDELLTAEADWDAPKKPSVRKDFAGMIRA
jgi:hypothetical protein